MIMNSTIRFVSVYAKHEVKGKPWQETVHGALPQKVGLAEAQQRGSVIIRASSTAATKPDLVTGGFESVLLFNIAQAVRAIRHPTIIETVTLSNEIIGELGPFPVPISPESSFVLGLKDPDDRISPVVFKLELELVRQGVALVKRSGRWFTANLIRPNEAAVDIVDAFAHIDQQSFK